MKTKNPKKVAITKKPTRKKIKEYTSDDWVSGTINSLDSEQQETIKDSESKRQNDQAKDMDEKMKRFTIDVPEDLHRRIKVSCANRGAKMADELRRILIVEFPAS